jgi:hypothetical protein
LSGSGRRISMFTDRILQDYCRQIREIEEKMEAGYRELAEKLIPNT